MTKIKVLKYYIIHILLLESIISSVVFSNPILITIIIILHLLVIYFKKFKPYKIQIIFFLFIFIFGVLRLQNEFNERYRILKDYQSKNNTLMTFYGVVTEPCFKQSDNKIGITINKKNWKIKGILNENVCDTKLKYGTKIKVKGSFQAYFEARNPGQFSQIKYGFKKKEVGIIFINSYQTDGVKITNPFKWIAYKIKPILLKQHQKAFPEPYSDLFTGLIFGIHGTSLPSILKEEFRRVGLLHILVVSGSQVSLLIGIILFFMNKVYLKNKIKWVILILICTIFYFLTGGGPSIGRAILMNIIAYSFTLINHNTSKHHIICFTAFIMLISDPFCIFDYGAQLSFMATIALIYGAPKFTTILPKQIPTIIREIIALSLAPIVFTSPLIWYYFNNLAPISFFSNIILLEIIECLVIIGFFSTLVGFIHYDIAHFFHQISLTALKTITFIVSFLDKLPLSSFFTQKPEKSIIILFYGGIIITLSKLKTKKRTLLIITFLIIAIYSYQLLPKNYQKITFLDVGQGDATLIQDMNNKVVLIDTGPRRYVNSKQPYFNVAKSVILPYLQKEGINSIDLLIITHFDLDHYGGLISLAQSIPIKMIIHNGNGTNYKWFNKLTKKYNIKTKTLNKNDVIKIQKNLTFYCLNTKNPNLTKKNNHSLVLKAKIYNTNFLLTGDIHSTIEESLVDKYSYFLDSDILKVAHHGSKTSSSEEFLKHVSPKSCIISAGINNRYHHPHEKTLNRLKENCDKVISTKNSGAIQLKISKKNQKIIKFINK